MRSGIFSQNKRQALRLIESQPSTVSQITFTPKENYLASRYFIEVLYVLSGASLTAFQTILTAQGFSTTAESRISTVNGRLQAVALLSNASFRSTFIDQITVDVLLKGSAPLKNRISATDSLLRDTIYSGTQPLIEWNFGGITGALRIGFWIHLERPFMNESAMLFTVENQNSVKLNLPILVTTTGNNTVNLYATRSIVEQKYLYFESSGSVQVVAPNAVINIDERNIDEVFLYEPANIVETTLFQTFLNGREVDAVFPNALRYNSLLDAGTYPLGAGEYVTTPNVVAPRSIELGFNKIFTHPVLNLPPTSNRNKNFRAQFGVTANTNVRYLFSKIMETDTSKLETENYVQAQQGVYTS